MAGASDVAPARLQHLHVGHHILLDLFRGPVYQRELHVDVAHEGDAIAKALLVVVVVHAVGIHGVDGHETGVYKPVKGVVDLSVAVEDGGHASSQRRGNDLLRSRQPDFLEQGGRDEQPFFPGEIVGHVNEVHALGHRLRGHAGVVVGAGVEHLLHQVALLIAHLHGVGQPHGKLVERLKDGGVEHADAQPRSLRRLLVLTQVLQPVLDVGVVRHDQRLPIGAGLELTVHGRNQAAVRLAALERRPKRLKHQNVLTHHLAELDEIPGMHGTAGGFAGALGRIAADCQRVPGKATQQLGHVLVVHQVFEVRHPVHLLAAQHRLEPREIGVANERRQLYSPTGPDDP